MSTIINAASVAGTLFIARHESPGGQAVRRAYRCPAGVITIGHGFTMRSKEFATWWLAKHGRPLRLGDTINQEDADTLLRRIIDREFGKAVAERIRPRKAHHYDGGASVSFNCGSGSLEWKWAKALAAGRVGEAAKRLRTTAVTANGRRLAGLVRRRAEEAELIEHGRYTAHLVSSAVSSRHEEIVEYQKQLIALGYALGKSGPDGRAGPKTIEAVRAFQKAHKLTADGIVGPATRATLIRALDTKRAKQATSGAGGLGAVGGAVPAEIAAQPVDAIVSALAWGVGAAAMIGIAFLILKYRGLITGRRVPT